MRHTPCLPYDHHVTDTRHSWLVSIAAQATTTLAEWDNHCTWLTTAATQAVVDGDWNMVEVFGPSDSSFSWPTFALIVPLVDDAIGEMAGVADREGWKLPLMMRRIMVEDVSMWDGFWRVLHGVRL